MPNILRQNNPKAERFQQLLALAGLAQQQEQGQSSLQQQLAFHQASLQQQEADARQMQAWREMQGQQAVTNENNRVGEFYSTTAPAEWAKLEALKVGQAQNHGDAAASLAQQVTRDQLLSTERTQQHSDAVATLTQQHSDATAALTQQQTAHEQAIKAQLLEHYSSLPPDQQNSVRGLLRTQYPWFAEGDDARHASEVESTYNRLLPAIATPGITPAQREQQLTDWATKSFVHPDVIKRLRAFTPPTPIAVAPTQHFGVSTDLAPPGVPTPQPATPLPGSVDYMYQQQQGTLPQTVPSLSRNQLESARAAQTRRLLEAANLTAN